MDDITRLSPVLPVNMSDTWFEIANLQHFWIRRRFEVLQRLWRNSDPTVRVAEVGCGHGLVLRQIMDAFGIKPDGFDLNEQALKQADADSGRLFYYNIHDRAAAFEGQYDVIFLFDVIEHLEDDAGFFASVLFHLKKGGRLIVNVPAYQRLYSRYDQVVGHQRRYDIGLLGKLCDATHLRVASWSYWGLLYIPIVLLRQQLMRHVADADIIKDGFAPKHPLINTGMLLLGRMEWLPNHFAGTSLMAVLERK